jgi:hypothetical protein
LTEERAVREHGDRPFVSLVKRATRNGCDDDSGTPPSGEKRKLASPGTFFASSSTIVALLSGMSTGKGMSYRVVPASIATAASALTLRGAEGITPCGRGASMGFGVAWGMGMPP